MKTYLKALALFWAWNILAIYPILAVFVGIDPHNWPEGAWSAQIVAGGFVGLCIFLTHLITTKND